MKYDMIHINMRKHLYLFMLFIIMFACEVNAQPYTINKQVKGKKHMVVTAHPLASEAGLIILKKGGNAIDAMVAVHFVLAVVYQRAGNIGGGGYLIYRRNHYDIQALDFRETAPELASRNMYIQQNGHINDSVSKDGHLASGIPGSVAGIYDAHKEHGTLPWKTLLQSAISYAENGFLLTEKEAEELNKNRLDFKRLNNHKTVFYQDIPWKTGDKIVQKDLANTLRMIQKYGKDGFYKGAIADLIVKEMKSGGGIITHKDLSEYKPIWHKPIEFTYRDSFTVYTMPPSSAGGMILNEMMNMSETINLHLLGFHTTASIHWMAETEKRAYADRAVYCGDADYYNVPIKGLTAKNYAKHRISTFNPMKTIPSEQMKEGTLQYASEETTHYSIVDSYGQAVSVTTTLNGNYGSRVIVKGAGFVLNNEMDDFSVKPGTPNMFGLIGAEANAIQPGKRMLSSMTPLIVQKNDSLFLIAGTPGGATITTSMYQLLINMIDFDMSLQQAIHSPRFHHQWLPDILYHEADCFDTATKKELEQIGYTLKQRSAIGRIDAIYIAPDTSIEGIGDNRGDDSASGE
jgi:gamma-glutamyltranspeptidase/glutathione hydrolase